MVKRALIFVMGLVVVLVLCSSTEESMAFTKPVIADLAPAVTHEAPKLFQKILQKQCVPVRMCGSRRRGRYRCKKTARCRECRFIKRCERGVGCFWSERCRWRVVR